MKKMAALFLLLAALSACTLAQDVGYFDNLYGFYSHRFFKRITRLHIKDWQWGITGKKDSNFFMHPQIIEPDHALILRASLRAAWLYKHRMLVEILPSVSYDLHDQHSEYNFFNRTLTFNLYNKLSHRLLMTNSYSTSLRRMRLYDTFGSNALFNTKAYKLNVSRSLGSRTALAFEFKYADIRVSGDYFSESTNLDERFTRTEKSMGLLVDYKITAKTKFRLAAHHYRNHFPDFLRQNHEGEKFVLGLHFPRLIAEESRMGGRIMFGLKSCDLSYFNKHYLTWIGDTDFFMCLGHVRFKLILDRDFDIALFQISPLVRTSAYVGLDYYLNKRLFVGLGYRQGMLDYLVPFVVDYRRTFVKADYKTPVFSVGFKTLYDFWLRFDLSLADWNSDQYFYYNKKQTVLTVSFVKRR